MPRGKPRKAGVFEKMLEKEIGRSFVAILEERGLATIKDVRRIIGEIKDLRRQVKGLSARKGAKAGAGRAGRRPTHDSCTAPGCKKEHYAKGLCAGHYQKSRRGDAPVAAKGRRKKATKATKK